MTVETIVMMAVDFLNYNGFCVSTNVRWYLHISIIYRCYILKGLVMIIAMLFVSVFNNCL